MGPFFELRIYEVYKGKMSDWIKFMNEEIIPFQREKGMEINGTFIMNSSDKFFEERGERKMFFLLDKNQIPARKKIKYCDYIIVNNRSKKLLEKQVNGIIK